MSESQKPDISICMVSLNCWKVLKDCLDSLRESAPSLSHEIILVDNGSTDGTRERVKADYPEVHLIESPENVGFLRGTNQGMKLSQGRYILWLNPDTIVRPDSLRKLVEFLETHPKAGIVGPKVLNADGSFQPQCRRGMPTPTAALSYWARLDKLRPNNKMFGQYLMTFLPVDQANPVDAVSGCCLMARRQVLNEVGLMDEKVFGFGEDLDWCVCTKKAGWEVWYNPASVITHLKGQGGRHVKPYYVARGMHHAMWVFYCKHLRQQSRWPIPAMVRVGIWGSLVLSLSGIWVRRNVLKWGK